MDGGGAAGPRNADAAAGCRTAAGEAKGTPARSSRRGPASLGPDEGGTRGSDFPLHSTRRRLATLVCSFTRDQALLARKLVPFVRHAGAGSGTKALPRPDKPPARNERAAVCGGMGAHAPIPAAGFKGGSG